MIFTHDFRADLDQMDFWGPDKFAFARFADGEHAILTGSPLHVSTKYWQVDSDHIANWMRTALYDALVLDDPNYHVGISCPCCDKEANAWYQAALADREIPEERTTYSNLFVNGNYDEFMLRGVGLAHEQCIVGSYECADIRIPKSAMYQESRGYWSRVLEEMSRLHRTIFVAAGPIGKILIEAYWQNMAPCDRQTIVDIGSTLDPLFHGERTRGYHDPAHPNRKKMCRWT